MDNCYYSVLGVEKDANFDTIKKQWKKLVVKYHPDRLPDDKKEWGENKMKEINEAYKVLSNKDSRKRYDMFGKEEMGHHQDMFPRNMDIVAPVKTSVCLSMEQLFTGCNLSVNIDRCTLCTKCNTTGFADGVEHSCKTCNGSGYISHNIQIGPGMVQQIRQQCPKCEGSCSDKGFKKCSGCKGSKYIKNKHNVKISVKPGTVHQHVEQIENEGNEIPVEMRRDNDSRGRVLITVLEKEHPTFTRGVPINGVSNSSNIILTLTVKLVESLCGFRKSFTHLDGRKINIEEVDVVKDGEIKLLRGLGFPDYRRPDCKTGDLFVKYKVEYPDITYEQKMLIHKILTGKEYIDNHQGDYVYSESIEHYEVEQDDSESGHGTGQECHMQ